MATTRPSKHLVRQNNQSNHTTSLSSNMHHSSNPCHMHSSSLPSIFSSINNLCQQCPRLINCNRRSSISTIKWVWSEVVTTNQWIRVLIREVRKKFYKNKGLKNYKSRSECAMKGVNLNLTKKDKNSTWCTMSHPNTHKGNPHLTKYSKKSLTTNPNQVTISKISNSQLSTSNTNNKVTVQCNLSKTFLKWRQGAESQTTGWIWS